MASRVGRWLKGVLSPGVVPLAAPERAGPFPDEAKAAAAVREMDERYADFLNVHLGYFEAQELEGKWFAVRVLGSERERPSSVQWLAGLGP